MSFRKIFLKQRRRGRVIKQAFPGGSTLLAKDYEDAAEYGDLDQADFSVLASLLRRYGKDKALSDVRHVHTHLITCGYDSNTFLGNCLIHVYSHCGSIEDAQSCFDIISPNCYSWTILIKAYAQNGGFDVAANVFNKMPHRDVVSWNAIIALLAQHGQSQEALNFFHHMSSEDVKANDVTFLCALDACARLQALDEGQKVHSAIVDGGFGKHVAVGTALIDMYGKCGSVHKARSVFDSLPLRDVVPWTAMIAAYAGNGNSKDALYLFHQMQVEGITPDIVTYVCLLDMCARLTALEEGKDVHAAIEDSGCGKNVMVATALINMYGKCACVHEAGNVFGGMVHRDIVSYNAMITAFEQNEHGQEALDLFYQVFYEGLEPDSVTFVCALDACSSLAAFEEGKEIHAAIVYDEFEKNTLIWFALIKMYGKSGSVRNAKDLFSRMPHPNLVSWNSMIALLSLNGHSKEALVLFHQMQIEGVKPDDSTFVSILSACSHTGLVDYGKYVFGSISRDHDIVHTAGHYLSLIDLLGRAGLLDEAEFLIHNMPSEIVPVAWRCLLGACIIHGDEERGVRAANFCFTSEPTNSVLYVMLSNLFAVTGTSADDA